MSILSAAGHIVGALSAVTVLHALFFAISRKVAARRAASELESIGAEMGIPPGELMNSEHDAAIRGAAMVRYSSELFRNRLSDVVGLMLTVAGWLSVVVQLGIPAGTAWYCWLNERIDLVALWLMPLAYLLYLLLVSIVSAACLVLTGRMPGQAKMTRRAFGYRT